MLIPESGKPADLDLEAIQTAADADLVIDWLRDVRRDMEGQIADNAISKTRAQDWVVRTRAAIRHTMNTQYKVAQTRAGLIRAGVTKNDLFVEEASKLFEDDDLAEVWDRVEVRLAA